MGWTRIAKCFIAIFMKLAEIATWLRSRETKRKYSCAYLRTTPLLMSSLLSACPKSSLSHSWPGTITCLRTLSLHFISPTESYSSMATTTRSMRHHRLDSSTKAQKAQKLNVNVRLEARKLHNSTRSRN